jgi:outer membrane protein OmpA-like peptidoglycan-associated protein
MLTNLSHIFKRCCKFVAYYTSGALLGSAFTPATCARGEGFNAENFSPAIDNRSGIMWETVRTIPDRHFLLGYTASYAWRPVEIGDGNDERIPVLDHLFVNHFGVGYGMGEWFDVGINIPIALYSAPSSVGGYIDGIRDRTRNFFFLGDPRARAKLTYFKDPGGVFFAGVIGSLSLPFGSTPAMLSDDATRFSLELPFEVDLMAKRLELYLSPGVSFWSSKDRINHTDPNTLERSHLLEKSNSLLLSGGGRFWLVPRGPGGLQIEGGIRGDFEGFVPSLNKRGSPIEWSGGGLLFLTKKLSVHGGYGTGLGSGVGAPLSRIVAGVRYLVEPDNKPIIEREGREQSNLSSEAFTDRELDEVIQNAQREQEPPRLANEDTMLRLLKENGVIDMGPVRFEYNSAKLTPEAKQTVAKLHGYLKELKPKSVRIEGHTDSVGSYKYNLALSKRRADAVKAELAHLGFDARIVTTDGYAYKYPIESNATRIGRVRNRRIEVGLDGRTSRKSSYTKDEQDRMNEWIAPGGKQPTSNQDGPAGK